MFPGEFFIVCIERKEVDKESDWSDDRITNNEETHPNQGFGELSKSVVEEEETIRMESNENRMNLGALESSWNQIEVVHQVRAERPETIDHDEK